MHTEAVVVTSITITLHTCRHAKIWPDHSQIASYGPDLAMKLLAPTIYTSIQWNDY